MNKLTGLHILLTYQCTFECDHCFVWGSPWQNGVMTLEHIHDVLTQAREFEDLEWIYFEGGEPFLYYPTLLRGVQMATAMGFHVGIVTNAFWAVTPADALVWLKPLADMIEDLSISDDLYHYDQINSQNVINAIAAASDLKIPFDTISIAPANSIAGKVDGQGELMYRGRAASTLAANATHHPWNTFLRCPHENLRAPGRVHLDPFGNVHICQGISLGNIFKRSLKEVCDEYYADAHPICAPLIKGGPAGLVDEYDLVHADSYADACHLCYEARLALRDRFPDVLTPDQMYGS